MGKSQRAFFSFPSPLSSPRERRAHYGEGLGRVSYPTCAHLPVNETLHCVTQSDAHYFTRVTVMLHSEAPDQSGYSHRNC